MSTYLGEDHGSIGIFTKTKQKVASYTSTQVRKKPIEREAFLHELKLRNIRISMDGKGRWMDNVMVERLWRSVKHEEIYLKV